MPIPWFIIKATAVASIGGILFGYDLGVISGALPQLTEAFDLSETQQEWVVGILYLGGGIGAALGGPLTDVCGRKSAILVCDVVFGVGALLLYFANSVSHLYVGRIVVGFGISVSGIADVAYLHELAPPEWRGSIVSVNEACISLGFMIAFCIGYALRENAEGWRDMFGFSGYLAMIQLLLMWTIMPESPVWLQQKGRMAEREKVLQKLYGNNSRSSSSCSITMIRRRKRSSDTATDQDETDDDDNDDEQEKLPCCRLAEHEEPANVSPDFVVPELPCTIKNNVRGTSREYLVDALKEDTVINNKNYKSTTDEENGGDGFEANDDEKEVKWSSWRAALIRWRKQAYIALFLSIAQQLSGQTSVLSYAPLIFSSIATSGNNNSTESATLYIGFFKFVVTVLVIWRIEYMGRKCLLLSGMGTIVIGQACIALAFYFGMGDEDENDNNNEEAPQHPGTLLAVGGALLVVMGYSASFGPLTWLLTSELFPANIRGRALGSSTVVTYIFASITTSTFLSMESWVGSSAVFALYGGVTLLGMVFVWGAVPDSGNKSAEEIDASLCTMWWWRHSNGGRSELRSTSLVFSTLGQEGTMRIPEAELT